MSKDENFQKAKEFIDEILEKSKAGEFIFRGTPEVYSHEDDGINSGLYREYKGTSDEDSLIDREESAVKEVRKRCTKNASNIEILTDLRHLGSKQTTLIDFSYSLYIALFFACNDSFDEDGELILLDRNEKKRLEEIEYSNNNAEEAIIEPALSQNTRSRVQFQSSVFVRAPKGYIEKGFTPIKVPWVLKETILDVLQKYHNIRTDTVYNDLYGFIEKEKRAKEAKIESNKEAKIEFYKELAKTASRDYTGAIQYYTKAIELKPDLTTAYTSWGVAKAYLVYYEEASQDSTKASKLKPNLAAAYYNRGFVKATFGDYTGAIQDYTKAIELKPNLAEAYINRGNARADLGDYEGGIEDSTKALS